MVSVATGHKGFAVFLKGDGVDGVECDPVVCFQERDEMAGGLFQADTHAGFGMALALLEQPLAKVFGRAVQGFGTGFCGPGVDEVQVDFAIGTIQADDQVVGSIYIEHDFVVLCLWFKGSPQA